MAFGGKAWPINSNDMNLGRVSTSSAICAGGIFDLNAGSNIGGGGGNPNWVVGATFLKNVYSVFRSQPAAVGFAELSDAAGGSSGESCNPACSFYQEVSTDQGTPVGSTSQTSTSTRSTGTPSGSGPGTDGEQTVTFCASTTGTNKIIFPFYSCVFVQGLACDAFDGHYRSVCLLVLSGITTDRF